MSNINTLKIDYRNLKPCQCRIDGQDHFCMFRTPNSPCMKKRREGFKELLAGMEETFNTVKDDMITKLKTRVKKRDRRY